MTAVAARIAPVRRPARRRHFDLPLFGSGAVVALIAVAALAGQLLNAQAQVGDQSRRLLGFGVDGHLLGTDGQGRDVATRLLAGAGPSLLSGLLPMVIATMVGVALGITAGLVGRRVNAVIMRTLDVFFAFPGVLLAIAIAAALGQGFTSVVLSLAIVMIPPIARVSEVETRRVVGQEYIESAIASGAGRFRIAGTQILPVIAGPVLVYATSLLGLSIVYAAGLSFLGLGAAPPSPDWGLMIDDLRRSIFARPELALVPAIAITVVAVALNVFGNVLARRLQSSGVVR